MIFQKNDLVYIPFLGTSIYKIEDIIENRIVVNGSFIELYSNYYVYRYNKNNLPVTGNFNYHTGYLTNEGKIVTGDTMNPVYDDDEIVEVKEFIGNLTSKLIYPATLRNHWLLEELTKDVFEKPKSPVQTAIDLLSLGPILCKAGNDITYENLLLEDNYILITRYDTNNDLFYDQNDNSYDIVIPVDNQGREIKEKLND